MTIDDVRQILQRCASPDHGVLLDDGEFHISAQSPESGLLLKVCDIALLEEDDSECHGAYHRRADGVWMLGFCMGSESGDGTVQHVSAEADDRDHAIAILWLMRHKTAGYRSG